MDNLGKNTKNIFTSLQTNYKTILENKQISDASNNIKNTSKLMLDKLQLNENIKKINDSSKDFLNNIQIPKQFKNLTLLDILGINQKIRFYKYSAIGVSTVLFGTYVYIKTRPTIIIVNNDKKI